VQQAFIFIHNFLNFFPELFSSDEAFVMPKLSVLSFSHYIKLFYHKVQFLRRSSVNFLAIWKIGVGICHFEDRPERWLD
jgi:hypothetical protein